MKKYGSHISFTKTNNYLIGAVEETLANKATAMMIYLGGPQSSIRVKTSEYKINEYKTKYSSIIKPEDIIIHAPYIVNPASISKGEFAVKFLIEEIQRMNSFGAKYLVLHPGAFTEFTKDDSIKELIKNLKLIIEHTLGVEILLETMSGKGTEIGSTFEELKEIIEGVSSTRLGICFDTCHTWDAGYDIKNPREVINQLNSLELTNLIKVIHVNDSKNEKGSKKDRHENIGVGQIGTEAIKNFIEQPEFADTYQILETPYVNDKPIYDKEIQLLFGK